MDQYAFGFATLNPKFHWLRQIATTLCEFHWLFWNFTHKEVI